MRSAFDFAPFRRSTVGFDRLFDMLENSSLGAAQENYPPFDLIKGGENEYRIELAVAGFKPEEFDITSQQNQLIVSGRKTEETEQKGSDYIYRGIANRSFERRFALADHIKVTGADMKDGLLVINLVREIPESMKPRKIDIGGSESRQAIGGGERKPAAEQTVDAEVEHAREAASSERRRPRRRTPGPFFFRVGRVLPDSRLGDFGRAGGDHRDLHVRQAGIEGREKLAVQLALELAVGPAFHGPHAGLAVDPFELHLMVLDWFPGVLEGRGVRPGG
jgi:molecular chaperone IbpA